MGTFRLNSAKKVLREPRLTAAKKLLFDLMFCDTIAAVSTNMSGPSGINIIRISGKEAHEIAFSVFRSKKAGKKPEPNRMYLGDVEGANFKEKAFCVIFYSPKSYTGENMAEIHCHGGIAVTRAILRLLISKGARPARPGEFTERAYLNGKIDLSRAEGVAEIISAESEAEIRNAYRLMTGELYAGLLDAERFITDAAAILEVKLDYPEETEDAERERARALLASAGEKIGKLLATASRRKSIKHGVDVAIVGNPNAGKSSLLNALINDERAIVTSIPGTTRDVIAESAEIDGVRYNFFDTAGIRKSRDEIEFMGIERSKRAIESADLVIFLLDETAGSEGEREIEKLLAGKNVVRAGNKTDVKKFKKGEIEISAKYGDNVDELIKLIAKKVGRDEIYNSGVLTNERHISALSDCKAALDDAEKAFDGVPDECVLTDVKIALDALGKISGKTATEEVVSRIFKTFCVGK